MGGNQEGLGGYLICYLDTQIAVWLAEANLKKLSATAASMAAKSELLISPMVMMELQFLYEIGRIIATPPAVLVKLSAELGVSVCRHPFAAIAETALGETWTRDPFDRVIVAHARSNQAAPLLTKDESIHAHYNHARW